ncbi:hypothetical protein LLG95_10875, partial [bacterium]|nr:hypothetical protein [bacterium]
MRIYDLAKAIGQAFSVEVKSKELADEFKSMPEFAPIHDQIKSHSSSVGDEYAAKMFEIYRQRLGKSRTETPALGKESVSSSVVKTEVKPQPKPVAPTATVPPRQAPPVAPRPSAAPVAPR